jgi:VWFA-related protein
LQIIDNKPPRLICNLFRNCFVNNTQEHASAEAKANRKFAPLPPFFLRQRQATSGNVICFAKILTAAKIRSKSKVKIRQKSIGIFIFLVLFIASAKIVAAQQPTSTPKPDEDEVIKVSSKLVVVPVSVTDANGQPVKNLTKNDFRIAEEGKTQQITEISTAEETPLEIALLVDVSSSTNPLFDYEKAAAARFLQTVMKPQDRASVFLIGNEATLAHPRDTAEKIAAFVRNVNPTKDYTAFFDTVLSAVDYLKKNAPQNSRRVILCLTDGEDTYSKNTLTAYEGAYREMDAKINTLTPVQRAEILNRYRLQGLDKNWNQILKQLQTADTVFYSVNPSGGQIKLNKISSRGQEGLQKFADETGGAAFLPTLLPTNNPKEPLRSAENARTNELNLEKIFQQIAAELRAQYLLQFYSEANFPNGKYVNLTVAVPANQNFRVKARRGYFATNQ